MLAIRMQRTGRKGHAMYRVVVQDSHKTPTAGKVVAQLGSYDPHAKTVTLAKDKAEFYLSHGAQPSDRVVLLLQKEGVKMPSWVKATTTKKAGIRNPEKLRRNRPAEETKEESEEAPAAEAATPAPDAEATQEADNEAPENSTDVASEAVEAPDVPDVPATETADTAETADVSEKQ